MKRAKILLASSTCSYESTGAIIQNGTKKRNKPNSMIDTVILTIPSNKIYGTKGEGYSNTRWDLQSRTRNYEKHVRNPSAIMVREDVYLPRLTHIKRRAKGSIEMTAFVKIEFSVPKLLFGNNLDEVCENDFKKVIATLQTRLALMEVSIDAKVLREASVSAFHPSKNIKLSEGYTASFVASELAKINLNKKFDIDKTKFRNNGSSLQGWTISHSLVFYDKIADMAQKPKKAIDKDQTPQQLSLFALLKSSKVPIEVIRMEVRLSLKQKLNSVMEKLGFKKNPSFQDIFKKNVCQKIVAHYWNTLIKDENLFLFEYENSPKQILKEVLRKQKKIKPKEAIYLVGLNLLCKDEGGIRDLRGILKQHLSPRGWYRVSDSIKLLNKNSRRKAHHTWIKQIEDAIQNFEPFKSGLDPP